MSQTIVITGASAGLGLAIVKHLLTLPEQHTLICCCNTNSEPLKTLASSNIHIIKGDVSDKTFLTTLFPQSLHHFNITHIDALVLNHGTLGTCSRIADMQPEEWEGVFRVNVTSYVGLVQQCLPFLRESHGRIIMTSSGAAESAYSSWGAYGASKAAVNHLVKTLGKEEKDVVTVAVRPGMLQGRMQEDIRGKLGGNMDEDDRQKFVGAFGQGKLLRPEQPGNVMARLALRAGKALSGKFVQWNGDELKDFQD